MKLPLIGTIVLTLFIAETVQAQKYPIRLSSPDHIGKKSHVSVIGSFNQEAASTQNGSVLKSVSTNRLVIFEGREEVLSLDADGVALRESFTVEKFTNLENGVTGILLNPGSVILTDGSQEKAKQIVLKNGVMSEAARTAFSWILAPHSPDRHSDDEIFGTKEPKAIGDSWPINKLAAISDLRGTLIIPIERMTGAVSLVSKGSISGDECLNLLAEVKADGVAIKNAPEGFVPDRGKMDITLRTCIPISPAANSRKDGAVMNSQIRLKGMPGTLIETVILEMTSNQRVEVTALPIK